MVWNPYWYEDIIGDGQRPPRRPPGRIPGVPALEEPLLSAPATAQPAGQIPDLGDVAPRQDYQWKPPVEMDWHKLQGKVSKETMAQLFAYWRDKTPVTATAQSELLGAGLDWYWGFGPGPPDRYFEKYAYDLKQMYERAVRESGYGTPRVYVPPLRQELAQTGMGPWYNYGRYRR